MIFLNVVSFQTSAPVKDEAQSPVAAIVNSSYKFPTTPSRRASAVNNACKQSRVYVSLLWNTLLRQSMFALH